MRSLTKLIALLLIATMLLVACGGGAEEPAPAPEEAPAEEAEAPAEEPMEEPTEEPMEEPTEEPMEEPTEEAAAEEEAMGDVVTLEFWHAMSGNLGELVDELAARFNESRDDVQVNVTFQGSYDDTYQALLAAMETGTEPNIIQNFDLASQTMVDTGRLIPASQLMEADGYDPDIFVPAVRDYYSDENGMLGLAFNSSTPLIYYNADMFAEAGIDPIEGSLSFSEFKALCDQIQEAGVAEFCFTHGQVGWYFEQILANSGGLYFNENNGRTGRPTEVLFNDEKGVEVFTFLTDVITEGYAPNLGSTWSETDSTFISEQAAIMIDSTSDVAIIENSEFEVGTAYIPHADSSERNGVIIGGAALWLIDSGEDAENAAAWEFMKFMAEPEQQITWHTGSGYFPVRVDLQDDPELNAFWDENPNFRTAFEQLATTGTTLDDGSPNYAVLGGRAGPFPAIRRLIVEAYSAVLDDGLSPQEALDIAAEKANQELADYNAFFE
ncbi:MAG: ABC transporter substrate-binding protein [Candidatus Promineifilaceae bacterium]|nr:ABC transporter substrate-binding protein [Candidatus Promineifilaceae bacterium]